jgi:hypothetical protein
MGFLDNLGLGNLTANLPSMGGIVKQNQGATQQPFKMNIGITDGDLPYDTMAEVLAIVGALAAGSVWTKIWEKTVGAQKTYRWGFGSPQTPYNQGYMWFCSMDITTDFEVGKLRLVQCNSAETRVFTVLEQDDTRLHLNVVTTLALATPIDIATMVALPEKVEFPQVGEDSKIQLYYRCITAATTEDQVGFSIPVTVRQ